MDTVKVSLNHAGGDNLPASACSEQVEPTLLEQICWMKTVMFTELKSGQGSQMIM